MATRKALYTAHRLNEIASKANAAAHQIHRWLTEPDSSEGDAFRRGMKGGMEVCQFLSERLEATLVRPVRFDQLGLVAELKPVREDLEKIGEKQLKEGADRALSVLRELLDATEQNRSVPQKYRAEEAQRFFRQVREPFLKAATSSLLRDRP